jgi:hypothetical protein
MISDNPLNDATDHINSMDSRPYEYDYICDCCGLGFDKGHGIEVTQEKFCNECVLECKHHRFYNKTCGLSVREANILIESNTKSL